MLTSLDSASENFAVKETFSISPLPLNEFVFPKKYLENPDHEKIVVRTLPDNASIDPTVTNVALGSGSPSNRKANENISTTPTFCLTDAELPNFCNINCETLDSSNIKQECMDNADVANPDTELPIKPKKKKGRPRKISTTPNFCLTDTDMPNLCNIDSEIFDSTE